MNIQVKPGWVVSAGASVSMEFEYVFLVCGYVH